eukprot:scaffold3080_cov38-Tisochrysis_lutea.AAC.7
MHRNGGRVQPKTLSWGLLWVQEQRGLNLQMLPLSSQHSMHIHWLGAYFISREPDTGHLSFC